MLSLTRHTGTLCALSLVLVFAGWQFLSGPDPSAGEPASGSADHRTGKKQGTVASRLSLETDISRKASGDELPSGAVSTPEAESGLVTILVLHDEGTAAAGIEIMASTLDGELERLGATDADGRLAARLPHAHGWLIPRHKAFTGEPVFFRRDAHHEYTLVLHAAGRLQGRVVDRAGRPVGAGVTVVAQRSMRVFPDPLLVRRYRNRLETDPVALTDGAGRFLIGGVESDCPYTLIATGGGWASAELIEPALPGGPDIELIVDRLFGVTVRLIDPRTGGLVDMAPEFTATTKGRIGISDPQVRAFPADRLVATLGCRDEPVLESGSSSYTYFFCGPPDRDVLGPLHFAVELPGYSPVVLDLLAWPVESLVRDQTFTLTPLSEHGTLEVSLEGWVDRAMDAGARHGPEMRLTLTAEDGSLLRYALPRQPEGKIELGGVPEGRYEVAVRSYCGGSDFVATHAGPPVVIAPGTTVRTTLDVSSAGALAVEPLNPNGTPYRGPLHVTLLKEIEGRGTARTESSLHRGPYVIRGLSSGTWGVAAARAKREALTRVLPVTIEAGQVTTVYLEID